MNESESGRLVWTGKFRTVARNVYRRQIMSDGDEGKVRVKVPPSQNYGLMQQAQEA